MDNTSPTHSDYVRLAFHRITELGDAVEIKLTAIIDGESGIIIRYGPATGARQIVQALHSLGTKFFLRKSK